MTLSIDSRNYTTSPLAMKAHLNKEDSSFLSSLSEEFASKIRHFITDFTDKSLFQLMRESVEMERRKSELACVHTLVHIAYLISEPDLNQTLLKLRQSEIKWGMFIKSMGESIQRGIVTLFL